MVLTGTWLDVKCTAPQPVHPHTSLEHVAPIAFIYGPFGAKLSPRVAFILPPHSIVQSRYNNCYCNDRRLEYKIPNKAILRHRLFKVWRDYFGFEMVYDDYDLFMDELAVKGRQFLLAQVPHAVMVRVFLMQLSFVGLNCRGLVLSGSPLSE